MKFLLECHGVDPDSWDRSWRTPLSFAALGGHEGVVKLLLERNRVNPNTLAGHDQTPLSLAASGGHEGVVKLLLKHPGVDPLHPMPISLAASGGHESIVKLLLEHKNAFLRTLHDPPLDQSYPYLAAPTPTSSLRSSLELPFFF